MVSGKGGPGVQKTLTHSPDDDHYHLAYHHHRHHHHHHHRHHHRHHDQGRINFTDPPPTEQAGREWREV